MHQPKTACWEKSNQFYAFLILHSNWNWHCKQIVWRVSWFSVHKTSYCKSGNIWTTLIFVLFAHFWASVKLSKCKKSIYNFVCIGTRRKAENRKSENNQVSVTAPRGGGWEGICPSPSQPPPSSEDLPSTCPPSSEGKMAKISHFW